MTPAPGTSSKTIEIIVKPDGQTTVQTRGYAGAGCRDASKFIEVALGTCTGETLTAEFYQAGTVEQPQSQQQ